MASELDIVRSGQRYGSPLETVFKAGWDESMHPRGFHGHWIRGLGSHKYHHGWGNSTSPGIKEIHTHEHVPPNAQPGKHYLRVNDRNTDEPIGYVGPFDSPDHAYQHEDQIFSDSYALVDHKGVPHPDIQPEIADEYSEMGGHPPYPGMEAAMLPSTIDAGAESAASVGRMEPGDFEGELSEADANAVIDAGRHIEDLLSSPTLDAVSADEIDAALKKWSLIDQKAGLAIDPDVVNEMRDALEALRAQ